MKASFFCLGLMNEYLISKNTVYNNSQKFTLLLIEWANQGVNNNFYYLKTEKLFSMTTKKNINTKIIDHVL
jgi:hypothetical protein